MKRQNKYLGNDYGMAAMFLDRYSNEDTRDTPRATLSQLAHARATVEAALTETVEAARADGMTWAQIAGEIGGTRQAAQQRYGNRPEPAPAQVERLPIKEFS